MSVSNVLEKHPPFQPFQCHVCQSRFTRQENLKRHAALHTRPRNEAALRCDICDCAFSRPDLRRRHMKKKHPESARDDRSMRWNQHGQPGSSAMRQLSDESVSPPQLRDVHVDGYDTGSYERLDLQQQATVWDAALGDNKSPTINFSHHQADQSIFGSNEQLDTTVHTDLAHASPSTMDSTTTPRTADHALQMYPTLFSASPFNDNDKLPSLSASPSTSSRHPQSASFCTDSTAFSFGNSAFDGVLPSFDLPLPQDDWYPSRSQISGGRKLFFNHISPFLPIFHEPTFDTSSIPSHLLLSVLSLAYQHGDDPDSNNQVASGPSLSLRCFKRARALTARDEDSPDGDATSADHLAMTQTYLLLQIYAMLYQSGSYSSYGLKLHSKMVSLARSGGLMQANIAETSSTRDLDSLWQQFIVSESRKRTLFALHQMDTLWYQFLSIPRLLSHLEVKHELPCPADFWAASTSAEWAHRQLAARSPGSMVPYPDAVRRFLSFDGGLDSLSEFDSYGAINITQFLISSAREVSGWSTMTGRLSMERLDPLRSSLLALRPFIHSRRGSALAATISLCEATWESAMIELQLWSPSHTGGIVGSSIDGFVAQLTDEAPPPEFLATTARAIQPHIDWFLRYLDSTYVVEVEAPWVALYAYKAFIIAWQLVRVATPATMQVVGIPDGDEQAALAWAKTVFQRRERWQHGKIIMSYLRKL